MMMRSALRWGVFGSGVFGLAMAAAMGASAQDRGKAAPAGSAASVGAVAATAIVPVASADVPPPPAGPNPGAEPYRRLPSNWGKLGLTAGQVERVYRVRGEYRAARQDLERRLKELKAQEDAACRAVLTDSQRRKLDQAKGASAPDEAEPGPGR